MAWNYSDTLQELFNDALSGRSKYMGKIEDADAVGQHGSISCGDAIVFSIKIKRNKKDPFQDRIIKARYQTFGCTSAIASSEALCHMVESKKMTPLEALQISARDIADFLGGVPDQKFHCSIMGAEVLRSTIINWAKSRGVDINDIIGNKPLHDDQSPVICECFNKTHNYIASNIEHHSLRNIDEIIAKIKVGGACGSCIDKPGGLYDIWAQINGLEAIYQKDQMELPQQMEEKIKLVIESAVKPELSKLASTIEIIDIKNNLIYCSLTGDKSLVKIVEEILQELVFNKLKVIDI